jgi:hypothetical protein
MQSLKKNGFGDIEENKPVCAKMLVSVSVRHRFNINPRLGNTLSKLKPINQ